MSGFQQLSVIKEKIQEIRNGQEAIFELPGIFDNRLNHFSSFFYRLLNHYNLAFLSEMILVVIREITGNCSRAAAKRLYFRDNQLDIYNKEEYHRGLKEFRKILSDEWESYCKKFKNEPYFIIIKIKVDDENIYLTVENNIEMLPLEKQRVMDRISSFAKFKSLNDAFSSIRDESEGAGLGFFLMLSLLKNSRISTDNFTLTSANGKTIHKIIIPLVTTPVAQKNVFFGKVIFEIKNLPSFPQNITSIIKMCQSNSSTVQTIAHEIQKDPSLTAQVLKLVNSAGYMSRNRNPSLEDGVKIIGLRVLQDLLMVSGARRAIQSKYKMRELEDIWENSNRVSFIARNLAKKYNQKVADQATIAGLLHALGNIVLLSLNPEVLQTVSELMETSRIKNGSVVEEAMLGISNSQTGYMMATNWNFPVSLQTAIQYQNQPLLAPDEFRDVIYCVYLGICLNHALNGSVGYWHIESEVLEEFGIQNESEFDRMKKSLHEQYTASQ